MSKSIFKRSGFTLIELIVALTILIVISAVVAPSFLGNLRGGKDRTAVERAKLIDAAKMSFVADMGKKKAAYLWAQADALDGYPSGDSRNTTAETTCDFKVTDAGLSPRDEAKYNLLLPYLSGSPRGANGSGNDFGLGDGARDNRYAKKGYRYHLNDLFATYTPPSMPPSNPPPSNPPPSNPPPSSPEPYTVTVNSSDDSMGTASGSGSYDEGKPATATATVKPSSIYMFTGWEIKKGSPSPFSLSNTSNTFNVMENVIVQANFAIDPNLFHSFNVIAGTGGKNASYTADPSNISYNGKWLAGSKFNITVSPDGNYNFANWTSDAGGSFASQQPTTTFTIGSANTIATANFSAATPKTFTVRVISYFDSSEAIQLINSMGGSTTVYDQLRDRVGSGKVLYQTTAQQGQNVAIPGVLSDGLDSVICDMTSGINFLISYRYAHGADGQGTAPDANGLNTSYTYIYNIQSDRDVYYVAYPQAWGAIGVP